tara:strand:- start:1952 stop:2845 length:894 start_codon:yes stop_codon:yes gene_type:complete
MGTPTLYYYPTGGRTLETVDLSEELTNLTAVPAIRREDAIALDGSMSTVVLGPLWEVRIMLERFGSPGANSIERKLQALANHLRRGGLCGVALDSGKAWCGRQSGATGRGYTYVATGGNAFAPWSAAAALVSGDEVAVEGAPPDFSHEVHGVSSMTGTRQVNLTESIIFDRVGGWTRHRDFWPVCYMSAEEAAKDPITHDHRRNYTLDLRLVFSPAMLATLLGSIGTGAPSGSWSVSAHSGAPSTSSYAKSPAFGDGSMLGAPSGAAGLGLVTTPTYSSNGRSLEELTGRKPMGPAR